MDDVIDICFTLHRPRVPIVAKHRGPPRYHARIIIALAEMSTIHEAGRASSDYGSDLDADGEEELCHLLEDIEVRRRARALFPSLAFSSQSDHVAPSLAIRPVGARSALRAMLDVESQDETWAVELDDESFGVDIAASMSSSPHSHHAAHER